MRRAWAVGLGIVLLASVAGRVHATASVVDIHLTQRIMFTECADPPSDHDNVTPYELCIRPGTTVNWYVESGKHNIAADDGSFNSGLLTAGMTYGHCFEQPGVYHFHDDFHLGGPQKALGGVIRVELATKP